MERSTSDGQAQYTALADLLAVRFGEVIEQEAQRAQQEGHTPIIFGLSITYAAIELAAINATTLLTSMGLDAGVVLPSEEPRTEVEMRLRERLLTALEQGLTVELAALGISAPLPWSGRAGTA